MCYLKIQGLFQMAVGVKAYFDRRNTSWTQDKLDNKQQRSVSRKSPHFKNKPAAEKNISHVSIYFPFLCLLVSVCFIPAQTLLSQNVTAIKVDPHITHFLSLFPDGKTVVLFLAKKIFRVENPWNNQNLPDSRLRWRSHTPLRLWSLLGRGMPARSSR